MDTFTAVGTHFQIRRLNDPGIRSLSIGSVGGFASARSIAQLYNSAILTGPGNTSPIISEAAWQHMYQHTSAHEQGGLFKRLGISSNWTMTAAGQSRNSPKVS